MDRRLICVRPMCGAAAQVSMHYSYADSTVWLELLGPDLPAGSWSVCTVHADSLRLPSGWQLVDGRGPAGAGEAASDPSRLHYAPPLAV